MNQDKFRQIRENRWAANEDIKFSYGKKDSFQITVEKDFDTDFASLPFPLNLFYSKYGKYALPAAVHDKLYRTKEFGKIMADAVFYQAMKEEGVKLFTRLLFYIGLILLGWYGWYRVGEKLIKLKKKIKWI